MHFYDLSVILESKIQMKKIQFLAAFVIIGLLVFNSCNSKKQSNEETILTGTVSVLVDETILPVIEDQKMVFENQYEAKVNLVPKSETEIVKLLSEGKNNLAILTRELSANEASFFTKEKIKAKVTSFGTDGIAFIANKSSEQKPIDLIEVYAFMKGDNQKFKGLVFDNANSSTLRYFREKAGLQNVTNPKVYSFKTNNEVIKFVADNPGMIGVVGINWIMQPMPNFQSVVDKVSVLQVKGNNNTFAQPTQDEIAAGIYPVTREIKMLNYQGYSGLGMGFASFVAGEIGQRIFLKSGLVPVRMPGRNLIIRKSVEKENK